MLKIKEGDGAILKLRADDPLRRQTKPITIKPQRSLQIVNTEGNNRDSWFHRRTSAPHWKWEIGYVLQRKVSTFKRWDAARRETRLTTCLKKKTNSARRRFIFYPLYWHSYSPREGLLLSAMFDPQYCIVGENKFVVPRRGRLRTWDDVCRKMGLEFIELRPFGAYFFETSPAELESTAVAFQASSLIPSQPVCRAGASLTHLQVASSDNPA